MVDGFSKPRCEDCFVYRDDPSPSADTLGWGFCHFNPQIVATKADHWCGRWRNIFLEKFARWDEPEDVHRHVVDP